MDNIDQNALMMDVFSSHFGWCCDINVVFHWDEKGERKREKKMWFYGLNVARGEICKL